MEDKADQRFSLSVSRLSRNVQAGHLEEIFGSFGSVIGVEVDVDKRNGMPKGTAVVQFSVAKDAENALVYMNGGQIDGATIVVSDFSHVPLSIDTARALEQRMEVTNGPQRRKRSRDRVGATDVNAKTKGREISATTTNNESKERARGDMEKGRSSVQNGQDYDVGKKSVRDSPHRQANSRKHRTQPAASHYGPALACASRNAVSYRNEQQGAARGVYGPASVSRPRPAYIPKSRNGHEAGRGRSPARRPRSPVAEGRRSGERNMSRRRDSRSRSRDVARSPYRGRGGRFASPSPRRGRPSASPQRYRRRYSHSRSSRSSSGGRTRGRRYSSSRSRSSSWGSSRGRTRRPRYSRSRSGSESSGRGGRRRSRSSSSSSSSGAGYGRRDKSRGRSYSRSTSPSRSRSRSGSGAS